VTSARVARGVRIGETAIEELNLMSRGTVREVLESHLPVDAREGLWTALEVYVTAQVGALKSLGALRLLRHDRLEPVPA
jgi:hypothetical protein